MTLAAPDGGTSDIDFSGVTRIDSQRATLVTGIEGDGVCLCGRDTAGDETERSDSAGGQRIPSLLVGGHIKILHDTVTVDDHCVKITRVGSRSSKFDSDIVAAEGWHFVLYVQGLYFPLLYTPAHLSAVQVSAIG